MVHFQTLNEELKTSTVSLFLVIHSDNWFIRRNYHAIQEASPPPGSIIFIGSQLWFIHMCITEIKLNLRRKPDRK